MPNTRPAPLLVVLLALVAPGLAAFAAPAAAEPPSFSKTFLPATIGPGSVSELRFTIVTTDQVNPVSALTFTDTLPAGVTIAAPPSASTTCGGAPTLSAPGGGSTIGFSGGTLAAAASCTVRVDVTSSTPGVHTNLSGDLTSSAGNSGAATADLTVDAARPGLLKSFSPSVVPLGGRSTLTLTVDNSSNPAAASQLAVTDNLPPGMVVASPANTVNTCGGDLTANPGATTFSLTSFSSLASVPAFSTCTISVDVTANATGTLVNRTGELTFVQGFVTLSAGRASAALTASNDPIVLQKSFIDDPAAPGGTVTLRFTVRNLSRGDAATAISFTDDLDAALSGLAAVGLPLADPCGAGSQLTGTSLLTLTAGNLPAGGTCTFDVTLQVPAGAATGSYTNTTSTITADQGGTPVSGAAASDLLFVAPVPIFTKSFIDDPVAGGGTVTLRFSITNTSSTDSVTDLAFLDDLDAAVPGMAASLPADGFCGPGSSMTVVIISGAQNLSMTGGSLAPGASCSFDVGLTLPDPAPGGTFLNTTSPLTGTVAGAAVSAPPASDPLVVVAAPALDKEFTDDPVLPGGTVILAFTLEHAAEAPADATGIGFTDDLGAALTGLTAITLPANGFCGPGSQLTGSSVLTMTGGTLAAGASCSFQVTLQVPAGAAAGSYTNTTGTVSATSLGLAVTSAPASDDLEVAAIVFTKSFTDDPVAPGGTVNLQFSIQNLDPAASATGVSFTDDLAAALAGLAATGLPQNDVCGPGSQISGTSVLTFTGGNLGPGVTCTFNVTVQVPAGASPGEYLNQTSPLSATVGGNPLTVRRAVDRLTVAIPLTLTKQFLNDPTPPGGTVTLRFTLANSDPDHAVTGISFTDDLNAALSGLAAVGLPANDVCGAGSQISGTGLLSFTGGSLGPGGSCFFDVTVQVPAGAPFGGTATNVTSPVDGTVDGVAVSGDPATDVLRIAALRLTKAFSGPTVAGGTVQLSFTLENLDTVNPAGGLAFSDDLEAVVTGLEATGLPVSNACGAGSQLAGTSVVTLTGGSLGPGSSCTFAVDLLVPAGAAPGTYPNATSQLFQSGLVAADPATDDLAIEPPPAFSKAFAPSTVVAGGTSTLTFTIDNSASALGASGLDFTDTLPAGVVVATPNAAVNGCGGTLTAPAGGGSVSLSGGSVAAGASCQISVDVVAAGAGVFVNVTGDLTSSSGTSGTATATLTAVEPLGFTKAFLSIFVLPGGRAEIEFVLTNGSATVALADLAFSDDLDAALPGLVAIDLPQSDVCGPGSQLTGTSTISLTGGSLAPGASCSFIVTVQVPTDAPFGTLINTTGPLTGTAQGSPVAAPAAADDIEVIFVEIEKEFAPPVVIGGGTTTLSFTLFNPDPVNPATDITFTDDLDAALPGLVAVGLPATDFCGAGSQLAGTSLITLSGVSLTPGAACDFDVLVAVPADTPAGTYTNQTSAVEALVGGQPVAGDPADAAVADLTVEGNVLVIPTQSTWGLLLLAALLGLAAVWRLRVG